MKTYVSWHPELELEEFIGKELYWPHAYADGNY